MSDARPTNRLAAAASPYLRQHGSNPVDWYPWGPEALARAKAEDKPILLSVGYSACHWCHVMAHESFEDEATAQVMNAHFINVKVDREERPDVDQLYQGVVQLLGRGGGWPLTVFLTPAREPFFGGTYFPPAPRHGLPAFKELLERIAHGWATVRGEFTGQAGELAKALAQVTQVGLEGSARVPVTREDVQQAAQWVARRVDPEHGGLGRGGPKFPNPMLLELALLGDEGAKRAALHSLDCMARRGLFDQLGGGFHRYSVDGQWAVPHFEKMLYDNAQLLHTYAQAKQVVDDPLWRRVAERTVGFLTRELRHPRGGFYSAMDADSEGEEGRSFVWTPAQLREALGEDADAAARYFGVTPEGNFEHGASVLSALDEDAAPPEVVARVTARLLEARARRVPPGTDDKVLTGWNGLMVRGLAFAGRAFERPEWVALAEGTARFLLDALRGPDGALRRAWRDGVAYGEGQLEDYGHLALGLVELFVATQERRWLDAALGLVEEAQARFWDEAKEAWLAAPRGTADLLLPVYALHDNAVPSGASTLCEALVALGALLTRPELTARAERYLSRSREAMVDNPFGYGHLFLVADALAEGGVVVKLEGPPGVAKAWQAALDREFLPGVLIEWIGGTQPRGMVCRGQTCSAPVDSPEALVARLTA